MKGAVFYGKNDLRVEDIVLPELRPDDVLIKVRACGICGTDMHIFDGDEGAAATPPGTVLGHEFSGDVVKIGREVTTVSEGDKVCVDPNKSCGKCYFCKKGVRHFCTELKTYGTTDNGAFADYCIVPESQVYKFSNNISYEEAAMTEPVACCLHGMDMCGLEHGDTVAVIGAGMIGMIMLRLSQLGGAKCVVVIEPIEEKRVQAEKLGADITIDPLNENVVEKLKENGIGQIDVVIECVGKTETLEMGVEIAGKDSTLMMFGLTKPDEVLGIKPFEIFKKELVIRSSYVNPNTQGRALGLIESSKIDVRSMIYKTIPLCELPNVLADKKERAKGKYIVNPMI